ncbi:sortase [Terribacillus saccharophilus]|uniref:Sortase n=1 Tax=Terribacillus saccharophilus TaxID=361277 RepID=A0A075LUI2_9BACI|nr:class D sortase [Terribacillus goriensis]AIF68038.1 sortase [Terribacillus goriensis]
MKRFAVILVVAGLLLVGYGGYEWYTTAKAQKDSLSSAKSMLHEAHAAEKLTPEQAEKEASSFEPGQGDVVGVLHVPKLDADLPIVEGTDADDLDKGVGHYKGTAYPLQDDQIVLSGHRDTVFRNMGEVKVGDTFVVEMPYGSFTYKVENTKIVDKDDLTVIVPTAPEEVLTVTTCYPFSYVGDAPERFVWTAVPVETE